jgi:hypothetical protein
MFVTKLTHVEAIEVHTELLREGSRQLSFADSRWAGE